MKNLIDLDNLTPEDLPRVLAAVKRVRRELARQKHVHALGLAQEKLAELRREAAKQGKRLTRRQTQTKGALEQNARKAAETRRKRQNLPTTCEVCGAEALAKGLCMRHHKSWKRSGLPREKFVQWYESRVGNQPDVAAV